jgi:hypothetical protein
MKGWLGIAREDGRWRVEVKSGGGEKWMGESRRESEKRRESGKEFYRKRS